MNPYSTLRTTMDHPVLFGLPLLMFGGLALMWQASKWSMIALWLFLKWTVIVSWLMVKWTLVVPTVAVAQLVARRVRDRQDTPAAPSDFPPSDRMAHLW